MSSKASASKLLWGSQVIRTDGVIFSHAPFNWTCKTIWAVIEETWLTRAGKVKRGGPFITVTYGQIMSALTECSSVTVFNKTFVYFLSFNGTCRCYVRDPRQARVPPLNSPSLVRKQNDCHKILKCSSSPEVKIENTVRPPSSSSSVVSLKGRQLTGYYHFVKGYKSVLVVTENSSYFRQSSVIK